MERQTSQELLLGRVRFGNGIKLEPSAFNLRPLPPHSPSTLYPRGTSTLFVTTHYGI